MERLGRGIFHDGTPSPIDPAVSGTRTPTREVGSAELWICAATQPGLRTGAAPRLERSMSWDTRKKLWAFLNRSFRERPLCADCVL
jgi:hypothetical protein